MTVSTSHIELSTRGHGQIIDITSEVRAKLAASGLRAGIGCVMVPGSTGAITTLEYEPGCVADLQRLLDQLAPPDANYAHHERWGDDNGHSHLRSALLGPSLAFPFVDGEPTLGTWQQIVFIDLDTRGRTRKLVVQLVGD